MCENNGYISVIFEFINNQRASVGSEMRGESNLKPERQANKGDSRRENRARKIKTLMFYHAHTETRAHASIHVHGECKKDMISVKMAEGRCSMEEGLGAMVSAAL